MPQLKKFFSGLKKVWDDVSRTDLPEELYDFQIQRATEEPTTYHDGDFVPQKAEEQDKRKKNSK